MTKAEMVAIVNLVNATWAPGDMDLKDVYTAWWRYLEDLDAAAVQSIVDELVIDAAPWRPKVGEIRRRVIDGPLGWPTPDAAWALAEACRFAADSGTDVPEMPEAVAPLLGECMRGSRYGGKAAFTEAWRVATAERYALPLK